MFNLISDNHAYQCSQHLHVNISVIMSFDIFFNSDLLKIYQVTVIFEHISFEDINTIQTQFTIIYRCFRQYGKKGTDISDNENVKILLLRVTIRCER